MFFIQGINKQNGFTLIELVLVIIILSILAVVGSKMLSAGFNNYLSSRHVMDADAQISVALERMQRDIRQVRSPSSVTTIGINQFVFADTSGNTITYSLSGTSLMRQANAGTSQVLADGIQALTFAYFDKNLASTATPANVRYVTINLTITLNNTNFGAESAIYLRNAP